MKDGVSEDSVVKGSVVLVSGWAMSANILGGLADALKQQGCSIKVMSLADADGESWDELLEALKVLVGDQPAVLAGWSLGGNLCARFAARYPELASGVLTMGSTPCFVAGENWQAGKHPDAYQEFADAVAEDFPATIKGFAPLCAHGSDNRKTQVRALRSAAMWAVEQQETTNWRALLDRLAEDARSEWQKVSCSGVHLLAEGDTLAKPGIAQDLQSLLPQHTVTLLPGSHCIFMDHQDTVTQTLITMLKHDSEGR